MEKQIEGDTIKKLIQDIEIMEQHCFTEPEVDEGMTGKITSMQIKAIK